jgi:hypothetical protein
VKVSLDIFIIIVAFIIAVAVAFRGERLRWLYGLSEVIIGTLEKAAQMANHASTRTTQLYDRRREELSLDEVERIRV